MNRLRYRISQWEQAVKCKSNLSDKYSIHVSSVEYLPDISGKLIQVAHEHIGTLFSVLLDPKGERVDANHLYPMPTEQILEYLKSFGFDIEYRPEKSLPEAQKSYLKEILNLKMDKLRIIYVQQYVNGMNTLKPILTAFSSSVLSEWLVNTYSCTQAEFNTKCGEGLAIRLDTKDFDWSWLTYVADIEHILNLK